MFEGPGVTEEAGERDGDAEDDDWGVKLVEVL